VFMLAPGDIFEGRYQIIELVGQGGFARVFRARQVGTERDVALKLMNAVEDANNPERARVAASRFEREIRAMSLLRSPYTVTLYDFGVTAKGERYMVSEFIEGPSLQQVISDRGALPPDEALRYLCQLCLSLKEAHARDILHRDIKPSNIMLHELVGIGTQAKLLDFGIAKSMGRTSALEDVTGDATLLGTVRYMSPEQLQNKPPAPTSDIYSLGLVLWEMLLGSRWTDAKDTIEIITLHLEGAAQRLPQPSGLDPAVEQLLRRMIATSRAERFQTVDEVLDAVQRIGHPAQGRSALVASISTEQARPPLPLLDADSVELIDPPPLPDASASSSLELSASNDGEDELLPVAGPPARQRVAPIAAVAALLILIVVGAITATRRDTPSPPQQPPKPPQQPPPVAPRYALTIQTTPAALPVSVNGVARGISPLKLELTAQDFPARLTTRGHGDAEASLVLTEPVAGEFSLALPDAAPDAAPDTEGASAPSVSGSGADAPSPTLEPAKPRKKSKRAKIVAIDEL
jgi:serine/threonine-protein kinase